MKKILIVDTNYGFTSDVESRLILDEIDNVEITTRNRIDGLHDEIDAIKPNELLIFANLLSSHPSWDFGVPVKTYARDANGISLSSEHGFPCYGIVKNASDLITAIEQNKLVSVTTEVQNAPQQVTQSPQNPQATPQIPNNAMPQQLQNEPVNQGNQTQWQGNVNQNSYPNMPQGYLQGNVNMGANGQNQGMYPPNMPQQGQSPYENAPLDDYVQQNREALLAALLKGQGSQQQPPSTPQSHPYPQQTGPQGPNGYGTQGWNPAPGYPQQNPQPGSQLPYGYGSYPQPGPYHNPDQGTGGCYDPWTVKPKAKVIGVYSAKGGVGKTTISCELATFLALTSNGRNNFKVCIADFNIDYGNVMNTLDFDARKACMTLWAADIRERIKYGEAPENINYTEPQIECFLQRKDKDGLYALLAPLTNADSMLISATEIKVMLRNLIYNGGFDFIICDTGNNTRDTTVVALENADEVFMVLTQSVNTANSNQSFLKTMGPARFDMNKIKTIINMIKNEREVGASVEEVENAIINPATQRPFECIARIKDSNAVRNSENMGEPLVYEPSHEFTRQIAELAKHVVGDNFVLPELPKRNLFVQLFDKIKH